MTEEKLDLKELIKYIDPAACTYSEWVEVGMALKHEGYSCDDWDEWSRPDKRYHAGDCEKKWNTFNGAAAPVTAGTIVQMAKDNGWHFQTDDGALDWDSVIGEQKDDLVLVNKSWIEGKELNIPDKWNPVEQITKYLETLFEAGETVGYVTESWEKDSKYLPTKGVYTRTAGELIEALSKCEGDIGRVIGDCKPEAGAWIRFNPLDGKGVKNENVTEFRYALVESDTTDITHQNQIIRELELPIACLVYSGGKSLHAIVRIDAANFDEYRKRVDYLYDVCKKNGIDIDRQNKNPSRLSRMPGVERNGKKQYLLDTNIGKSSWNEWKEWIESINDDLPDPESVADVWNDLPELAPPLIDGVLRQGHKMLVAGPSKAGKSFALIELCCAIAEGREWLGFKCTQGKIMYVNLELDRASCLHRFKDVYTTLGWAAENLHNIDVWNLRGKSIPMDKLAPKLIRRAAKKNYIAIVIDPIYKIITGDENSADQMSHFCNQFDKVCTELGCAVIYCHHHSKGAQGGKRSMDRASGSGVFARDPDALLDLIELDITDGIRKQQEDKAQCEICLKWMRRFKLPEPSQDEENTAHELLKMCGESLSPASRDLMLAEVRTAWNSIKQRTAWRVEGTLREFPKFAPVNLWFDYPVHRIDDTGVLEDIKPDSDFNSKNSPFRRNFSSKKTSSERKKDRTSSIETAFDACNMDGRVTVNELSEYLGVTAKTVRKRLTEHGGFWIDDGEVGKKNEGKSR